MPGNHVHVIDVNGQRDSCDVNQVDSCHVKRWPWSTSFITLMSHEWSTCFTSRQSRACPSVLTGPRPCCCRLRAIAPRAYGTRAARCLFSTSFRSCVPCPCALLLLPCPFLPHSLRLTASLPLFPSGQRSGATVVLLHHCCRGATVTTAVWMRGQGHSNTVTSVLFSHDESFALTASDDCSVKVRSPGFRV
jgi:hypothetical protein